MVVLTEQTDDSIWAVGTTRSGESVEHGLCRRLGEDRPDRASRFGCPGARRGAEAPAAAGTSRIPASPAAEATDAAEAMPALVPDRRHLDPKDR